MLTQDEIWITAGNGFTLRSASSFCESVLYCTSRGHSAPVSQCLRAKHCTSPGREYSCESTFKSKVLYITKPTGLLWVYVEEQSTAHHLADSAPVSLHLRAKYCTSPGRQCSCESTFKSKVLYVTRPTVFQGNRCASLVPKMFNWWRPKMCFSTLLLANCVEKSVDLPVSSQ